jgi:HSP20 family protein
MGPGSLKVKRLMPHVRGGERTMLARWNPWQDLFDMQRETSNLLRRAFSGVLPSVGSVADGDVWAPAMDVLTRDGDLVIRAELPGIDPEKDVDISVHKDVLTIKGERRHEEKTEGKDGFYRFESHYGSFRRSVVLPEGARPDDIRATYEDGILEVVVPRGGELSVPKRIPIGTGRKQRALTTRGSKK